MPVVSFSKTGTAPEDATWDWSAETQNKILGDDGDDWAKYKAANAWWDGSSGEDAQKKSAYKLPHHRMGESGELEAVWHGVSNAMARLEQTDLPEEDAHGVFDHLAKHYEQWDKTPPEWDRFWQGVQERRAKRVEQHRAERVGLALLPILASTRAPIIAADRPDGRATDDDLMYINRQARKPLTADDVYVLPTESSNRSIDSYYTRMTAKTLQNFADDATRGVAFCDSHRHYELPMGRTFYGESVTTERENGEHDQAAHLLTYMLRDMQLANGLNSNDVIRGLDGGVYQDISVGFKPTAYWCSICHCNMLTDWDCMHWPGQTYDTDDGEKLCTADVDANLAEHSLVYEGATPNAMTLKAQRELELGRATARSLAFVEDHCRALLRERWTGFGPGYQDIAAQATAHSATRVAELLAGVRDLDAPLTPETPKAAPIMPAATPAQFSDLGWLRQRAAEVQAAAQAVAAPETTEATETTTTDEEDYETMRGTQFIERWIALAEDEATRGGKEISAANMQTLRDMHTQLSEGHDTMDEALRMMSRFLDEKDGTNQPPDDEDGDGDAGEEDAAHKESGDDSDGEDTDDARAKPEQDPAPGEDDGDGDDDKPTRAAAEAAAGGAGVETRAAGDPVVTGDPLSRLSAEQREVYEAGVQARADIVTEVVKLGVRAVGPAFDPDFQRKLLERYTIGELREAREHYRAIAQQQLAPRGHWVTDTSIPAGGYWTSEPQAVAGRQTMAQDPNDPMALIATANSPRSITPGIAARTGLEAGAKGDPSLYTTGATSNRRRTRSR